MSSIFAPLPVDRQHHGVGRVAGVEKDDGAGAALGEVGGGDVAGDGDGFEPGGDGLGSVSV